MISKAVQRLLRGLIALLGAGVGAGLAAMTLQIITLTNPTMLVPVKWLIVIYTATCVVGALVFFLLSNAIIAKCVDWGAAIEQHMDSMTMPQIVSSVSGLICGLIIAALVSQILNFVGTSIFTTAMSSILYVVFGAMGLSIGRKRGPDISIWMEQRASGTPKEKRAWRKGSRRASREEDGELAADEDALPAAQAKILDTSVIIDGRIFDVAKTGFVEGEIVIPQFVLAELRHIADSADPLRRNRGRRGLDILKKMQTELKLPVRIDETDYDDVSEVDVKLLRLARDTGGVVMTNDFNLNKVAAVSGMRVLNVNDLAGALKPVVIPGEEMAVTVSKEGKEPGQGVGYLDDGTMIVVDGGRRHVGETVEVVVTTVLQTSAGRMIFTRLKAPEGSTRTPIAPMPVQAE